MRFFTPRLQKQSKNQNHRFLTLSFYYSALLLICQVFLPISGVFATSSYVSTNSNNFFFSDYTADFYLSRDSEGISHLKVIEKFTAEFPSYNQNHGITRIIPFTNQGGDNLTMPSDKHLDISVKHNDHSEEPYRIESEDGYFKVYLGDPEEYVRGSHTYELKYEFENVITEFSDADSAWQELYWDTNGNDWSQRFDQVTARIHFTEDIAPAYTGKSWCYVGSYGVSDQDRCETTKISDGVEFQASKLGRGENLTFDLEFQPDTFKSAPKHYNFTLLVVCFVNLAVFAFLISLSIKGRREVKPKREYYDGLFVKPEYSPPAGFTVAEMAANYIKTAKLGSSQVATLMELAVTHKIELIQTNTAKALGRTKISWKIRIKSLDLTPEQAIILKILNGKNGSLSVGQLITVKTHSSTSSLVKLGEDFKTKIKQSLQTKGLLVDKKAQKASGSKDYKNIFSTIMTLAFVWAFLVILLLVLTGDDMPSYQIIVGGLALALFDIFLPCVFAIFSCVQYSKFTRFIEHTEEGLRYSRYLEGLHEYISLAESERIQFLQSVEGADTTHKGIVKLYERLLPYAVVFRLEKSWLKELSKYYEYTDVSEPSWYSSVGTFNAIAFANAMQSVSTSVSNAAIHSTTSSSSSSFSGGGGGGFSGGGGGGGGGGGW